MFEQFKGEMRLIMSREKERKTLTSIGKEKYPRTASIKYQNKRFVPLLFVFFTMFVSSFRSINLFPVNNRTMMILLFVLFIFVYIIETRTRRTSTSLT